MRYAEAIQYIESLSAYGIVPGLSSITELCKRLGNPQDSIPFVHVAGTNGKGSVVSYVAQILQTAGYLVGKYSSPAVFDYRERFQVKGRMISQVAFCDCLEQVKACCEDMVADGLPHPTTFEVETALAFLYFAKKNCDIVVLETGMGGAQDATNVIQNTVVAVLTSISMDHMNFLGKTLEEIALNKAGIIKNQCAVVTCRQAREVEHILRQKVHREGGKLILADASHCKQVKYGLKKQSFTYDGLKQLQISLGGNYQIENAVVAIETIRALQKAGYEIAEKQLRQGLVETLWPGRFQQVARKPVWIIDGAHNEQAALCLKESIETILTKDQQENMIQIVGVLGDKEYEKVVSLICPYARQVITLTPPETKRALPANELAKVVQEYNTAVTTADSVEEAVEIGYLLADEDTVILAFGSLSYLGRLYQILENRKKK